ncbi:MAG: diaminopimelate epimerase [Pseudomonadota bacterium]
MATENISRKKARPFVKMQGQENDFVVFDCTKTMFASPAPIARKVLNRNSGVGGDQMILLIKSRKADFGMRTFNQDGSEAEMCGNGLRCLARFIKDNNFSSKKELTIETVAGIRKVRFVGAHSIEADMGEPKMKGKEIPVNLSGRVINRPVRIESKEFRITCLSMGNPHCVIFQEQLDDFPLQKFGPLLETYSIFPKKANVSFVNIFSKGDLHMRVWERGVGETRSCGTAACAATVAAVLNGFSERKTTVKQPGGKLIVDWNRKDNHVYLRGPVETVFCGEICL